ncbi:MAG: hypothetical protein UU64_C0006G0009 [candidate division WWE3 bacterium GW2011_GWF2_41_45]|nr:MAG: hypothetical protein UU55_C0005G0008 [candidate division WWE3 bacterium GW2011_GWC2_41_23]KKS10258.1 MAG: hypothetical protein UU64_C0006G0009 [candidate division WWE3 bacterium GW2011_GWF2_41_45]KKS12224.1 MAG: hypothetical protein UU68_C0003G0008 [candidate division WWE3 bacterium GW2011_GWF1_41_53]KKS20000.1 MAG: hypothetical protein UU79_C0005G0008 [candidate division WWE3 bacterium GW2011_GWE1_41_72]KKS27333.1 MAG: hypothetical protein UU86_C0021G0008 [candidate division WWE3 bacte
MHKHYIPVLRWRAAEKTALQKMGSKQKNLITPFIEVFMPQATVTKTPETRLEEQNSNFAGQLSEVWGKEAFFLDTHLLPQEYQTATTEYLLRSCVNSQLKVIPVLNFDSTEKLRQLAVNTTTNPSDEVCLRIFLKDLQNEDINQKIHDFLNSLNLLPTQIHFMVDLKYLDADEVPVYELINNLDIVTTCKTFFVAGGSFPKDLSEGFILGENHVIRKEWNLWQTLIAKLTKRKPSYSDYTTQHPIFYEPRTVSNFSASIRYTLEKDWLVMRGQGVLTPNSAGYRGFLANAQLISGSEVFKGPDFSYGDQFLQEKGSDLNSKPGNASNWVCVGISHHLAQVAHQVSNLP